MESAYSPQLLEDIETLKVVGFDAARAQLLPSLFKQVYGKELRACGSCHREAYDALILFSPNKVKKSSFDLQNQKTMNEHLSHRFKADKKNVQLPVRHKGAPMVINAKNLDQEKINILLNIDKYAHNLEPNPQFTGVHKAGTKEKALDAINDAKKKATAKKVQALSVEKSPNAPEVASVSTSTDQPNDGNVSKPKARRPKSK